MSLTTTTRRRNRRLLNLAAVILAAASVLLAVRAVQAVGEVTNLHVTAAATAAPSGDLNRFGVQATELQERQALVAAASWDGRDPFQAVPVKIPAPTSKKVTPRRVVVPSLRALLYDEARPAAQISVSGRISGWLDPGGSFAGWTVSTINPSSVRVTDGSRILELRLQQEARP